MRTTVMMLAIALTASSAAMAQDAVPPSPPQQVVSTAPVSAIDSQALNWAWAERDRAQRIRYFQTRQSERWERAERLTEMANAGQCDEAVTIARHERDADMAARLADACSPRRR